MMGTGRQTEQTLGTDIVVGIDGSEHSTTALAWAIAEAKLRGARVRAVLAWSFMGQDGGALKAGTTEVEALAALQRTIDGCAGDDAAIVDAVPVNDLPVDGLLEQATTAALLVVGSRGRGGLKGLVLGSTSRSVVERSPIPVVVIPLHE
jgi:nucleotide-binding universal stress UspA family protein